MCSLISILQRMAIMLALLLVGPAIAADTGFPDRQSPRPRTTSGVPHVQIGVQPVPELTDALLRQVDAIPHVEIRATVISMPGAKGFWLSDGLPLKRPDAIVGGREFAHVHPDGSLHVSLHPATARAAVEAGWAVAHPWAGRRPGWEGFVMIYTPLTEDELAVVVQLVRGSYEFVTGRPAE